MYYSQYDQDRFLNEVLFHNKKRGVFVDIGANDGVTFSNSCFFEKELQWTGVCFEPISEVFAKLDRNRISININGCASERPYKDVFYHVHGYGEMLSGLKSQYDERHIERIHNTVAEHGGYITETEVECFSVNEVLRKNHIEQIDFISVDTEGGELKILQSLDFDAWKIKAVVVENNYSEQDILQFMTAKGYIRVAYLSTDEIYINPVYYGRVKAFILRCRLKFTDLASRYNPVNNRT